jgi:hypothetical protein
MQAIAGTPDGTEPWRRINDRRDDPRIEKAPLADRLVGKAAGAAGARSSHGARLSIGNPATWLTLTVAGLAMGMMIFIMASGLTLVFGLMDVINFGHGAFISVGAFVGISALLALERLDRRRRRCCSTWPRSRRRDCGDVRHRRSGLGFRAGDRAAGLW